MLDGVGAQATDATIQILDTTFTVGGLVRAGVILIVAIAIGVGLSLLIRRRARRQDGAHTATWYTLARLTAYTVVGVGVLLAFTALGVPLDRFALIAGAIGVGLGFGLQSLFANFISGIVLLLDKSLKIGDFVELESGVTGRVRDIKMRATTIATNDNLDILVPNSEFVDGRVVNWTHRDVVRRLHVPFGVAYGTDKNIVKEAALSAASEVPFTLALDGPRRPQVWLTEFGDSSLNFELVIWLTADATKKPGAVTAAYNWALHTALQTHGIEIPFPQRDVHVNSVLGLSGEAARTALRLADAGSASTSGAEPPPRPAARNDAIDEVSDDARLVVDEQPDDEVASG
ncbi:mechanosensitive ion channel [Microbacterium awajiense]|uniref:Mechanosensitive ion channel n=1 Tax=Microbacterium awajiense TaxID=415214 RepID=A0ABP7AG27_9MICO